MSLVLNNWALVFWVVLEVIMVLFLKERIIESMMGLRPQQGNLKLVCRLFSLMRGLPSIRLK